MSDGIPASHGYDDGIADAYRNHVSESKARLGTMLGDLVEERSSGAHVWTTDGRRLIDCGGYGVFVFGHGHPHVVGAVQRQLHRHPLATRMLFEPRLAEASEALAAAAPDGLDFVRFTTGGAAATELAVKLARIHGQKHIVRMSNGYHGKTLGALSATSNPTYREPFTPLLSSTRTRYGDLDDLRETLETTPDAAVIVEPVQGEGGVVVPPDGYLRGVRALCDEYDAILIVDEIQTGMGRVGTWWGCDHDQVRPDIMLVGKGLSGGAVPVAAVVATAEVFHPLSDDPFLHSETFAGSPIACAAATAAIGVTDREDIPSRAGELGRTLKQRLSQIARRALGPLAADLRGRGLLIGLELTDPGLVGQLTIELLDRGVLVCHSLNNHGVLRLTPSTALTDSDVMHVTEAFAESCQSLRESPMGQSAAQHA